MLEDHQSGQQDYPPVSLVTRGNGKIIADLICLIDEEYDTDQPLLLFDPKETWKKTLLAPAPTPMREMMMPVFLKRRMRI